MTLTEFVNAYVKERGVKLLTHQKGILKAIEEGKMTYSGKSNGKSVLLDAILAYEEYKREI